MSGYTYFIASGNRVKIGKSNNPAYRFRALLVGSPDPLNLLLVLKGNQERELHQRFKASHIRGEWFIISDEIQKFIDHQKCHQACLEDLRLIEEVIVSRRGPCSLAQRAKYERSNDEKRLK